MDPSSMSFDTNGTNESAAFECAQQHTVASASGFFRCYIHFASQSIAWNVMGILLIVGSVVFNGLLIVLVMRNKLTVFDQITIGHCIVDGLTAIVDIPLYYTWSVFGYWPYGKPLGLFWVSYDNNINMTTNLHMLYMTYVALRSLQAPSTFRDELLIRRPYLVMLAFWCCGLLVWITTANVYGIADYTNRINYAPYYMPAVLNFLFWFVLLVGTLVTSSLFLSFLSQRRKKTAQKRRYNASAKRTTESSVPESAAAAAAAAVAVTAAHTNRNNSKSTSTDNNTSSNNRTSSRSKSIKIASVSSKAKNYNAQFKFSAITFSFWIQWIIPCVITIIEPFCPDCISETTEHLYWLTYTVCMTDPIVILLFNPNINFKMRRK